VFAACCSNTPRTRLRFSARTKTPPEKPFPAVIQATDLDCDEGDLFVVSAKINLARKGFTELQEGRVYHEMLKRINPATLKGGDLFEKKNPNGRVYTKKEAAAELRVHYSTFRNREALWHPYRAVQKDGKGNVVRRSGLTDDERRQIQQGKLLPTYASRLSLGESTVNVSRNGGQRITQKQRTLTMREMEALFDATPSTNTERRQAIAECMNKNYKVALNESSARMDEQMDRVEKDRGIRSGRKEKAA
jgi:hypothetical protein